MKKPDLLLSQPLYKSFVSDLMIFVIRDNQHYQLSPCQVHFASP